MGTGETRPSAAASAYQEEGGVWLGAGTNHTLAVFPTNAFITFPLWRGHSDNYNEQLHRDDNKKEKYLYIVT